MVCGEKLNYRSVMEPMTCHFCQEVKPGAISCLNGHFVCDACHGSDAFSSILSIASSATSSDPVEIAEQMMSHPTVPMIGGEHHAIVATSIMAALRNNGPISYKGHRVNVDDSFIERVLDRAWTEKLPSCMCANYGACGVSLGAGAVFSLITNATCDTPKAKERQLAMEVTNYIASEVANFRGTCCKLSTRLAIDGARIALRDYFSLDLPGKSIKCQYKKRNPYKCLGSLCPYFKA